MRPGELDDDVVAAWRAIQDRAGLESPFLGPEFACAVGRQRDCARVAVMLDAGTPVGFFAFERRAFNVGKPIGAGVSDCQAVVAEPGVEWRPDDLVRACGLAIWEFDHLVTEQPEFAPHHAAVAPTWQIDLAGGYDGFCHAVEQQSRSFVPRALRGIRRLEREVGPVRLVYDDPDPAAHRTIQRWKSNQYRRTGRPDLISRPWVAGLMNDLLAQSSPGFRCACTSLYAGDRLVAGQINLHGRRSISLWVIAYDPDLRRVGPGNIVDLLLVREAAGRGVTYIDLGKGDTHQKLRICAATAHVAEGAVARPGPVALARRTWHAPVRASRDFILRHPTLRSATRRGLRAAGTLRRTSSDGGIAGLESPPTGQLSRR